MVSYLHFDEPLLRKQFGIFWQARGTTRATAPKSTAAACPSQAPALAGKINIKQYMPFIIA